MQPEDDGADRSAADGVKRRGKRAVWILLLVCAIAASLSLSIFAGILAPPFGLLAIALVLTTIFWLIRAHLPSILLVFVSVLLISVVATQKMPKLRADRMKAEEGERLSRTWQTSGRFNQQLPIVVHLVFDEMMSAGAMTDDLPGGSITREALLEFGDKHSFRTFDSVYSRYYYTSEALDSLPNREYLGRTGMDSFSPLKFDTRTKSYTVATNAYFADMASRGYRTAVFQTTYMNFCADKNVDMCETFDSFDPGAEGPAGLDSPTARVSLWQTLLRAYEPSYTSKIGQKAIARAYGLETRQMGVSGNEGRYDVQRFPEWFDRFTRFAAAAPRGTHIYAHFLVPHAPYLLMENCVVAGKVDSGLMLARFPRTERADKRREYYEDYLGQVRCVANRLDNFMAAIGQNENFRDAMIVIHGDHGSRISIGDVLEDFSERDFVDNYGAYFAVRSPAVPPGVDCEFVSLPQVFRRYVARGGDTTASRKPLPLVVVSRVAGGGKVEAPMPPFGCGAGAATISQ